MSVAIDRVLITGASSGIGLDLAQRFLALGSHVIIHGRDPRKLEAARQALAHPPERLIAVAGDVGEASTALRLVQAAERHFDGLDILINSAGIFGAKPFVESTEAELDAFYTTNLKGTFLVTQAAVPLLSAAGGGAIINLGAVLVDQPTGAIPCAAAMSSKGAVHALTRSLAIELAPRNIRVNGVSPCVIRTPLIGQAADALAPMHPLQRIGEVKDTSDAVLYLARAGFVTGTILEVDGGYAHGR